MGSVIIYSVTGRCCDGVRVLGANIIVCNFQFNFEIGWLMRGEAFACGLGNAACFRVGIMSARVDMWVCHF